MNTNEEKKSPFEFHTQTAALAGAIALLTWSLSTVLDVRDKIVKMEERLATVQAQVAQGTDDRFRGSDWRVQKERLDERFNALKAQVEKDTERIDRLERLNEKHHPK